MEDGNTDRLSALAREVLEAAEKAGASLATAESCTGGFIATLLTNVEGLSHNFESGFVVYSDEAKSTVLGIPLADVREYGAVSREVALAMAKGAVGRAHCDFAVAVTGFTGPAGPGDENGLVHIAVADSSGHTVHNEHHFGEVEREEGRDLASAAALELLGNTLAVL